LLCAIAWAVTLAVGLGANTDAGVVVAFSGALLAFPAMLLGAFVALAASTLFPARGAIGVSISFWLVASIVAAIPLAAVEPQNRDRVELTQSVLAWILPGERLGDLRDLAFGNNVSGDAWLALVVLAGWLGAAMVLLQVRRSLAR
jgi:hypothetical protein